MASQTKSSTPVIQTSAAASPQRDDVGQFMAAMTHPLKRELQFLRETILAADTAIGEGIKWNAPSFHTSEYFATFNLRSVDRVQLIMHFGAKVNEISRSGVVIDDPAQLLAWRGKDRAIVTFLDMAHLSASREAFTGVLRQWIGHVR